MEGVWRGRGRVPDYPAYWTRPRAGSTTRDHSERTGLPIPEGRQIETEDGLLVDSIRGVDQPGYPINIEQPELIADPGAQYLDDY